MKTNAPNQYTGFRSTGIRFPFHVRSISHRFLSLPVDMEKLPHIQRLLKGEDPKSVFNTDCIHKARQAFNDLRKQFDFTYWAITEYHIRDINDADNIIPLRLNPYQYYAIDIMQRRRDLRIHSRYIITKTFRQCGLTTCVQAYMLWLQTYHCRNNYCIYSLPVSLNRMKADLCRHLKRDRVPAARRLHLPASRTAVHFNSYRNPDSGRGIDFGYVHFADMSKWRDPYGNLSSRCLKAAVSGVLHTYLSLVVFEGTLPKSDRIPIDYNDFRRILFPDRILLLRRFASNPYFLDYTALADHQTSPDLLLHINLDQASEKLHLTAYDPTGVR